MRYLKNVSKDTIKTRVGQPDSMVNYEFLPNKIVEVRDSDFEHIWKHWNRLSEVDAKGKLIREGGWEKQQEEAKEFYQRKVDAGQVGFKDALDNLEKCQTKVKRKKH